MNRIVSPIVTMLILVSLLCAPACKKQKQQTLTFEKQPVDVIVQPVQTGEFVKELNFKGSVAPWKKANIGPDVSGRIAKIFKKQGDVVKKGTRLAELDTTTMELQKKQAEAALEVAKAAYKDAKLNFDRIKTLYEKKAVSQMQYEKTALAMEAADTQMKSAEANLDVIEYTLKSSNMEAPFDGIITSKNNEEGDMINPMMGMSAGVLILMDLSKVKIEVDVPAEDIEKVQSGQPCRVKISSLPDEVFTGKVYSKNLAADPLSKTFKTEIVVENPALMIKAGVFAEVAVEILRRPGAIMLPHSAVVEEKTVVLYNDGRAKLVEVKVKDKNDRFFEIESGVTPGQLVVIQGNYDLKEGALIKAATGNGSELETGAGTAAAAGTSSQAAGEDAPVVKGE